MDSSGGGGGEGKSSNVGARGIRLLDDRRRLLFFLLLHVLRWRGDDDRDDRRGSLLRLSRHRCVREGGLSPLVLPPPLLLDARELILERRQSDPRAPGDLDDLLRRFIQFRRRRFDFPDHRLMRRRDFPFRLSFSDF